MATWDLHAKSGEVATVNHDKYRCRILCYRDTSKDVNGALPAKSNYEIRVMIKRIDISETRYQHYWSIEFTGALKHVNKRFLWPNITSATMTLTKNKEYLLYKKTVTLDNDGTSKTIRAVAKCLDTTPRSATITIKFNTALRAITPATPTGLHVQLTSSTQHTLYIDEPADTTANYISSYIIRCEVVDLHHRLLHRMSSDCPLHQIRHVATALPSTRSRAIDVQLPPGLVHSGCVLLYRISAKSVTGHTSSESEVYYACVESTPKLLTKDGWKDVIPYICDDPQSKVWQQPYNVQCLDNTGWWRTVQCDSDYKAGDDFNIVEK